MRAARMQRSNAYAVGSVGSATTYNDGESVAADVIGTARPSEGVLRRAASPPMGLARSPARLSPVVSGPGWRKLKTTAGAFDRSAAKGGGGSIYRRQAPNLFATRRNFFAESRHLPQFLCPHSELTGIRTTFLAVVTNTTYLSR